MKGRKEKQTLADGWSIKNYENKKTSADFSSTGPAHSAFKLRLQFQKLVNITRATLNTARAQINRAPKQHTVCNLLRSERTTPVMKDEVS